jgi:hypothetical protein
MLSGDPEIELAKLEANVTLRTRNVDKLLEVHAKLRGSNEPSVYELLVEGGPRYGVRVNLVARFDGSVSGWIFICVLVCLLHLSKPRWISVIFNLMV